jgi:DNA-binding CsgD family transcriptional regulator
VGGWARALASSRAATRVWMHGDLDRSAQMLDRQLGDARDDMRAELVVLISSALLQALSGRLARAREDLAAAERRLRALGKPAFVPQWEQAALACDWAAGDWTAAEERSARLAAMPPVPATITLSLRVELLRQSGQREAAEQAAPQLAAQPPSPLAAWALAGLDRRPATALKRLREAAGSGRGGMLPLLLHRMAETAWTVGDERAAAKAHADLRRLDRDDPMARVADGLAGAYATGAAELARTAQEAAEFWGLAALATECLTARGRLGDAPARTLRAARDRWQEIGAHDRVGELAARLNEPAPAGAVPARLTPRERELAALVQAGHTNREIAAAMHLSVKTIEAYLTRVYTKTECSSRLELAVAVSQGHIAVDGPACACSHRPD